MKVSCMPTTGCTTIFCQQNSTLDVLVDSCCGYWHTLCRQNWSGAQDLAHCIINSYKFCLCRALGIHFFLQDVEYVTPLPSVIMMPLWLCMSGLSTHHCASAPIRIVNVSSLVQSRYCITLVSYLKSYSSGWNCTRLHRNATAVWISYLVPYCMRICFTVSTRDVHHKYLY